MENLPEILVDFKEKVNTNAQVKKLMQAWNPNVIVKSINSDDIYTLLIRDQQITDIKTLEDVANHQIHIEADKEILSQVFSGTLNPSQAVLDGDMIVFGEDKDQIKLDAITLLIWGM